MGVVKIHCGECNKDSGGNGGDHSRSAIHNLFGNFKKSHLHSTLHIKQWCKRKAILYNDHPKKEGNKGKPLIFSAADHKQRLDEGLSILQSVNDSISTNDPPFVLVGDASASELKSFWYKVRCKIDGELMLLCPSKNNLRINLLNHVEGLIHTKCCGDLVAAGKSSSAGTALHTGKRGRPTTLSKSTIGKQPDLYFWFSLASPADSTSTGDGASGMNSNSFLSLLCWGFWKKTT